MNSVSDVFSHQRIYIGLVVIPSITLFVIFEQLLGFSGWLSISAGVIGFLIGYFVGVKLEKLEYITTIKGKLVYFGLGAFFPLLFIFSRILSFGYEGFIFLCIYALIFFFAHYSLIDKSLNSRNR